MGGALTEHVQAAPVPVSDLRLGQPRGVGAVPNRVAALANHRGGLLILGVKDVAGVAIGLDPYTGKTAEAEKRRLRQAVVNFVAPQPDTTFVAVSAADGGPSGLTGQDGFYLVVVVPPSPRAPHAVLGDAGEGRRSLR